jgi:hypothetical protein
MQAREHHERCFSDRVRSAVPPSSLRLRECLLPVNSGDISPNMPNTVCGNQSRMREKLHLGFLSKFADALHIPNVPSTASILKWVVVDILGSLMIFCAITSPAETILPSGPL